MQLTLVGATLKSASILALPCSSFVVVVLDPHASAAATQAAQRILLMLEGPPSSLPWEGSAAAAVYDRGGRSLQRDPETSAAGLFVQSLATDSSRTSSSATNIV